MDRATANSRQRVKQMLKRAKAAQGLAGPEGTAALIATFRNPNTAANTSGSERWIVLLELADMARREGQHEAARGLYREVVALRPKRSQAWLEYARMEEEAGELERAQHVLRRGLRFCPLCEVLMTRLLRVEERTGGLARARALVARLEELPLEKTWRTVLEGAVLEARHGHAAEARRIFERLMAGVPWYGPVFQEAYRFEDGCEDFERAVAVVERGLRENPKYGPLWFSALRLFEKVAPERLPGAFRSAAECLLSDLRWKVHFEHAQACERAARYGEARAAYRAALDTCPANLAWKVWFGAARTETCAERPDAARACLAHATQLAPPKVAGTLCLERARLEEYARCPDAARALLQAAIQEGYGSGGTPQAGTAGSTSSASSATTSGASGTATTAVVADWKIYLETVLLELRAGDTGAALARVREALAVHTDTGRLWATHVQLLAHAPAGEQAAVLARALAAVPKSGEVWCEGARMHMRHGRYAEARQCLQRATLFTPQYGDSFVECLRVDLLEHGTLTPARAAAVQQQCLNAEPNYGPLWLHCKRTPLDSPGQVLRHARALLAHARDCPASDTARYLADTNELYRAALSLPPGRERLKIIFGTDTIRL